MQVLDANGPPLPTRSVVSIGMFDGVHRGHRSVLAQLREEGCRQGVPTVVLTFDPHPRAVLAPHAAPRMISSLSDRIELLAATGAVDHVLVLAFDRRRSEEPVEQFVRQTLVERLRMRTLVVGENFACGRGRRGDIHCLARLGSAEGFEVRALALRKVADGDAGQTCSSTATRRLIESGDLQAAALLLERPHELPGTVAHAGQARSVDALFGGGLCVPPADEYLGAVRHRQPDSDWVPALLEVHDDPASRRRSVRIRADFRATSGDTVSLRFFAKSAQIELTAIESGLLEGRGESRTQGTRVLA